MISLLALSCLNLSLIGPMQIILVLYCILEDQFFFSRQDEMSENCVLSAFIADASPLFLNMKTIKWTAHVTRLSVLWTSLNLGPVNKMETILNSNLN